jgi:hypothetical protein
MWEINHENRNDGRSTPHMSIEPHLPALDIVKSFQNCVPEDVVLDEKLGHGSVKRGRLHEVIRRNMKIAFVFHHACIMHLDVWELISIARTPRKLNKMTIS